MDVIYSNVNLANCHGSVPVIWPEPALITNINDCLFNLADFNLALKTLFALEIAMICSQANMQ